METCVQVVWWEDFQSLWGKQHWIDRRVEEHYGWNRAFSWPYRSSGAKMKLQSILNWEKGSRTLDRWTNQSLDTGFSRKEACTFSKTTPFNHRWYPGKCSALLYQQPTLSSWDLILKDLGSMPQHPPWGIWEISKGWPRGPWGAENAE